MVHHPTTYQSLVYLLLNENKPVNVYLYKVNNRSKIQRCEICSKLVKTPERCY